MHQNKKYSLTTTKNLIENKLYQNGDFFFSFFFHFFPFWWEFWFSSNVSNVSSSHFLWKILMYFPRPLVTRRKQTFAAPSSYEKKMRLVFSSIFTLIYLFFFWRFGDADWPSKPKWHLRNVSIWSWWDTYRQ